jgi:hypothetical protein
VEEWHERLKLPMADSTSDKAEWEAVLDLSKKFESVLKKITELSEAGLTSLMVVADFLRRQIAPLQQQNRGA